MRRNIPRLVRWYQAKYGRPLQGRVTALLLLYPKVEHPTRLVWEGARFTGADTTATLRELSSELAEYHGNAITSRVTP